MRERLSRFAHTLCKRRQISLVTRFETYLSTLSSGDTFIAYVLGVFVVASSFLGAYALERTMLVEVPAHGGSLTEGVLGSPRFVNPLLALSDADRDLTALTYAGLIGTGPDGALVPVLAQSYDVSDDATVYTFVIRENARFHDGSAVTADDVVFTVKKAQDPSLKSPQLANWANIRAEAVDSRTVRFTLPKAYAPFLEDATLGILPARLWRDLSNEEFPFSPLMQKPVGAGPFKVSSVKRTGNGIIEKYTLKAFNEYALGKPYLDAINFEFFSQEADLARAYERGRVESAYGLAEPGALQAPYARVFGVFWNASQNPMFARLEVRKALSLALDRTSIVQEVLGGYGTPIEGPVPPGSGIDVSVTSLGTDERRELARATLEKNGWAYDEEAGRWKQKKDGLTLEFTLKTSNVPELKAAAGAAKKQWEAFGVPVSLEFYEPGDLTTSVIRPRKYEALLFGMVVGRDHDLFAFWESSQRNSPGLNVALYANRIVDGLLEDIREETDNKTALNELAELNTTIAADYPAAFIYAPDFLYVFPEKLHGVVIDQIASPADRFASVASWYRESERVWPIFLK